MDRVHWLTGGLGISLSPAAAHALPEFLEINSNTTTTFTYATELKFYSRISKKYYFDFFQKNVRCLFPKTTVFIMRPRRGFPKEFHFQQLSSRPENGLWAATTPTPNTEETLSGTTAGHQLTCKGVHESGQRAIEHLKEGISARVSARAAQDGVLQHVRDAGAVHGRGAELHAAARQQKQAEGSGGRHGYRCDCMCHPLTTQPLSKTVSDITQKIPIHTLGFYSRHLRT